MGAAGGCLGGCLAELWAGVGAPVGLKLVSGVCCVCFEARASRVKPKTKRQRSKVEVEGPPTTAATTNARCSPIAHVSLVGISPNLVKNRVCPCVKIHPHHSPSLVATSNRASTMSARQHRACRASQGPRVRFYFPFLTRNDTDTRLGVFGRFGRGAGDM